MSQRTKSHRTRWGRFRNPLTERTARLREIVKAWIRNDAPTTPREPVRIERRTLEDFSTPPESGLRITWLGHSTSLVEIDGHRLLIDPVWSERSSPVQWLGPKRFFEPPLPLESLPNLDAVLISHDHYDHLDRKTVVQLADLGVPFLVPLRVGALIAKWGVPVEQIHELDWWDEIDVGGVTVAATPARHFSGRSPFMTDRNRTLWSGFAIIGPAHRVYYAGDTAMFGGFEEIGAAFGPFDVMLIEIGAYSRLWGDVHIGPEQAIDAFRQARGGLLIPVHWATFDLAMHGWTEPVERLLAKAERCGADVTVPRPGQSVEPASPPSPERWWPKLPWQTAEEHPVVSSGQIPDIESATSTHDRSVQITQAESCI